MIQKGSILIKLTPQYQMVFIPLKMIGLWYKILIPEVVRVCLPSQQRQTLTNFLSLNSVLSFFSFISYVHQLQHDGGDNNNHVLIEQHGCNGIS